MPKGKKLDSYKVPHIWEPSNEINPPEYWCRVCGFRITRQEMLHGMRSKKGCLPGQWQ